MAIPVKEVEPDEPIVCESPMAVDGKEVEVLIGEIQAATRSALRSVERLKPRKKGDWTEDRISGSPLLSRFRRSPLKLPFAFEGRTESVILPQKRDLSEFVRNSLRFCPTRLSLLPTQDAASQSPSTRYLATGGTDWRTQLSTLEECGETTVVPNTKPVGQVRQSRTRRREDCPAPGPDSHSPMPANQSNRKRVYVSPIVRGRQRGNHA